MKWFFIPVVFILSYNAYASCSYEDGIQTLAMVGYHEARGEGKRGMKAVMEVVMVRVDHPYFPNDICKVVYQPSSDIENKPLACAFSFTCDPKLKLATTDVVSYSEAKRIAEAVYVATKYSVRNADHYLICNIKDKVVWTRKMRYIGRVGKHCFYKENKR